MPTAYNSVVYSEDISAKQFITRCSKAFSFSDNIKDEPIDAPYPERFEYDRYYFDLMNDNIKKLEYLNSITDEEYAKIENNDYELAIANNKSKLEYNQIALDRFKRLREEVNTWQVPDDLKEVKILTLEQIDIGISDCEYYVNFCCKPIDRAKRTKQNDIIQIQKDIIYYGECYQDEMLKVNNDNLILNKFRNSLESLVMLKV